MKHFKDTRDANGGTVCGAPWDEDGEAKNVGECCRDCITVCARRAVQSFGKKSGVDAKFGGWI